MIHVAIAQERFTVQNVTHIQVFIGCLHSKDPNTLKYFEKCGVKLPTNASRLYGHALAGERAVQINRYCETTNTTVNFMCSLTGVTNINIQLSFS